MSFASTPLGQIRRLDQNAFLNRPNPNGRPENGPPPAQPPQRSNSNAYSYGASAASRSQQGLSRSRSRSELQQDTLDDVASYALQQQQQQASSSATSKLRPDKWAVKDTSVQVANAFQQAAHDMHASNPTYAWASQAPRQIVPRSTSVEYEAQSQTATMRRLGAPPSKSATLVNGPARRARPLERNETTLVVDVDSPPSRGKSPFEAFGNAVNSVLGSGASFLMKRREKANTTQETSYDYAEEERAVQQERRRRARISADNKAYEPSESDLESDSDDSDDVKRRRRRAVKKTASVASGFDKPQKRRRANGAPAPTDDDDTTGSEELEPSPNLRATPAAPAVSARPPIPHATLRRSAPPSEKHAALDSSVEYSADGGLASIAEQDESGEDVSAPELDGLSSALSEPEGLTAYPVVHRRAFSLGGALGHIVNVLYRLALALLAIIANIGSALVLFAGRVTGHMFDFVMRPFAWLGAHPSHVAIASLILLASVSWMALREPLSRAFPGRRGQTPVYYPPSDRPAQDITELSARLVNVESAVSGLSLENARARDQADREARHGEQLRERLGVLELKVKEQIRHADQAEERVRRLEMFKTRDVDSLKRDVEALRQIIASHSEAGTDSGAGSSSDPEARARIRIVEERLVEAETGLKEALETGRSVAARLDEQSKSGVTPGAGSSTAWWQKVIPGSGSKSGSLTIKASDGQDVTGLIAHLVDTAVSRTSKDDLARADFALHSGGGAVIPSLTSDTYEVRPATLAGKALGLVTGHGYALGRPPVTALHHELHIGHCWPFAGTQGQLGIKLAAPTYIEDVTIDHVAKEVAFDMRSAPRDMELWGLVEGEDNLAKVREYYAAKARAREERRAARIAGGDAPDAEDDEDEEQVPPALPQGVTYIRVARFAYDVDSSAHIQTFPADADVRALGIDFGVVVLAVKSNWGMDDFTCLYRVRVHGERMVPTSSPAGDAQEPVSDA